jgi:DNA repair exonuclease SbcCD nuclease subunit
MRITRFSSETAKRLREARFQALEKIRDAAKAQAVDFVVVAGDLFDDQAVDADIAGRAFRLLDSFPVPVYVISGNHDPLLPGSVWDRPPWNAGNSGKVRLLREPRPVEVVEGVVLYPCPIYRKTSHKDPTAWIAETPKDVDTICLGLAHGSLKIRDDLPADDHLIPRTAATDLKLDYLALGHWHGRKAFPSPDGVERTAYCGVHEPMRFPDNTESRTGWSPYSSGKVAELLEAGKGEVLWVQIERRGTPPVLRALNVGHAIWVEESRELRTADDLSKLIDELATREAAERRLLRLRLTGVVDAGVKQGVRQLGKILDRYLFHELDESGLHMQPTEEQMTAVAGLGVLRHVLERLQQETTSADEKVRQVAERAMQLLYQIAEVTHG